MSQYTKELADEIIKNKDHIASTKMKCEWTPFARGGSFFKWNCFLSLNYNTIPEYSFIVMGNRSDLRNLSDAVYGDRKKQ
jgi:hypothetical protein